MLSLVLSVKAVKILTKGEKMSLKKKIKKIVLKKVKKKDWADIAVTYGFKGKKAAKKKVLAKAGMGYLKWFV